MAEKTGVVLDRRGLIAVKGEDSREFLQGLISNDINKVSENQAIYAALLTPQGRYLHDFFIALLGEALILDCEAERRADLMRRFAFYKLRSKVTLEDVSETFLVAALIGEAALGSLGLDGEPGRAASFGGGVVFADPRLGALGARAILPRAGAESVLTRIGFLPAGAGTAEDYERLRLSLGVPDGSRDLEVEKAFPMENGFDELNGLDWNKGCYMGQELTARIKHRGLVKKRLMPVAVDGPLPAPGTPVMLGNSEAGEIRSGMEKIALAVLRLEAVSEARAEGVILTAGEAGIMPFTPDWASFFSEDGDELRPPESDTKTDPKAPADPGPPSPAR